MELSSWLQPKPKLSYDWTKMIEIEKHIPMKMNLYVGCVNWQQQIDIFFF